jgi:hypothetical protein
MLASDLRSEEVIRLLGPSDVAHNAQNGEDARRFLLHSNMSLLAFWLIPVTLIHDAVFERRGLDCTSQARRKIDVRRR